MSELSAEEWRELASEALDAARADARNAAFHNESARLYSREADREAPS